MPAPKILAIKLSLTKPKKIKTVNSKKVTGVAIA
jgi:hypothetical protein